MKILILIPLWKRPEVVRYCVESLKNLQKKELIPLFILSPEDPHAEELEQIINGFRFVRYKNDRLGLKMNVGIKASMNLEWDWFMSFGSDDTLELRFFDEIRPYLESKTPFFGYNSCFVENFKTKERYYLKNVCEEYPIGAGRMISRELMDRMINIEKYPLYNSDVQSGLDGNSTRRIKEATQIKPVIIRTENPPITDHKTLTNINPIELIKKYMKKKDGRELAEFMYFYDRYSEIRNQTPQPTMRAAYRKVEEEHETFFGYRRYSSFESFYQVMRRKSV